MRKRMTRADRVERNREALLAAARRVFLERGYHGASLDAIADEAGFSKGVVYSQFRSKADMFLALLERRIAERRESQLKSARRVTASHDWRGFLDQARRLSRADPAWNLLVLEFRIAAARDAELSARYGRLHQNTIDGLVEVLELLYSRSGVAPPDDLETVAVSLLALANGGMLEEAALGGGRTSDEALSASIGRLLGLPPDSTQRKSR